MRNAQLMLFAIMAILAIGMVNLSFASALTSTPNPFSLSNNTIDMGQISIANTIISGGKAPYTGSYSFVPSNSLGNNVAYNISIGYRPFGIAISPSGTFAYVTEFNSSTVSVINIPTNTVVDNITVGSGPKGVAFSPSGAFAYVTNLKSGTVSVISTATNTVVKNITVGYGPSDVAFSPSGNFAYVTNYNISTVSVINTATNTVVDTIDVKSNPYGVAFNPSGTLAYVTDVGADAVSVINTATNTVVDNITVGSEPYDVAITQSGATAYVTNFLSSTVSVIDTSTNTVSSTIDLGNSQYLEPFGITISPSGKFAYVAYTNGVSIINTATNTIANTINTGVGENPVSIAFTPSGTTAYVTNFLSNNITIINPATNQSVGSISLGLAPYGIAINPSGTSAYLTQYNGNTLSIIDTATGSISKRITVGQNPTDVAFNPSGTLAYVTNFNVSTVTVIDTATETVANTIKLGTGANPVGIAFSPSGDLAYVVDNGTGNVSVIDTLTNTISKNITVGYTPDYIALNPSGTFAYVTNYGSNNITVIDTATDNAVKSINVGTSPTDVAFNPSGTLAYVTNSGSDTVSVINTATNTVINNIAVGPTPYGVAFNPSGTLAYVLDNGNGRVNVISTATNTILYNITLGTGLIGISFNPSGTQAYITNLDTDTVTIINLPETSMGQLQSNNELTAKIDTLSDNTITITFNGITSEFSTGSNTIYGDWTFYGYAQDNTTGLAGITGLTGTNTTTSSNTLRIDPAPSATSLTPTNAIIDLGQSETYSVTIGGGTPPFTAKLVYVSGPSGATVDGLTPGSAVETLTGQNDGTLTFQSFNGFSTVGTYTFNVVATDSASTPVTFSSNSNSVIVNLPLSAGAPTPSSPTIDNGQSITLTANPSGGTSPYSYQWYTATSSGTCSSSDTVISGATRSTYTASPTSSTYYCYIVTDSESPAVSADSPTDLVTVNPALGTPTLSPTSETLDSGQSVTFSGTWTGGTPDYTATLYSSSTSTCTSSSNVVQELTGLTSDSASFFSQSPSSTTYYCLYVTDSSANPPTTNSITSDIKVDPAPSATSLTPTNAIIDLGQSETYSVTIGGGTPPFTAKLVYVSGPSGATVDGLTPGNAVETLTGQNDGTLTFQSFNGFSTVGTYTFNVVATDSASTPVTFSSTSNTVTVNPTPTIKSFTPSNSTINPLGQYVTYNAIINGGTLPINLDLVLVSNSIPLQINGANAIPGNTYGAILLIGAGSLESNTVITFRSIKLSSSIMSGGTAVFTVNAFDKASTPFKFNSTDSNIIIRSNVGSGPGTPTEYTFTLSDNINSTMQSDQPVYTVSTSNGTMSYYQDQLPATISLPTPYIDLKWSCNISIGQNNYKYQNDVYGLGVGIPCGTYYNTTTPTIESIYSLSQQKVVKTTTNTTTTIPTTTIQYNRGLVTFNGSVSSSSPKTINLTHIEVYITTSSTKPIPISAILRNYTGAQLPKLHNYTLISAINMTVSATNNVSIKVVSPYPCDLNPSLITPFELVNGSWLEITPFHVNSSSCTVSFNVPEDPVIGIFQRTLPTTTTIAPTTTVGNTTPVQKTPQQRGSEIPIIALAAIVVVIIVAAGAYHYSKRGRSHGKRR